MSATIVNETADSLTLQVVIKFNPSMLEAENVICDVLNQAGTLATANFGSGVTEAACKMIVKQRLCCSGMKWKEAGAAVVLTLRTLSHSSGRS